MVKNVIWAQSAKQQLFQIHSRIKEKSAVRANEIIAAILTETAQLSKSHDTGTPERLLHKEPKEYRFVIIGFYKIIYSIEENVVISIVHHIRETPIRES